MDAIHTNASFPSSSQKLGDGRPQPPGQHDEYAVRGIALAVQRLPALDVDPVEGEINLNQSRFVLVLLLRMVMKLRD